MTKQDLIKGIIELSEELKNAEGMGALVDINEMELLVDKYVEGLGKKLPIANVNTRFLFDKGLEYAYDKAKETHLSGDGVLNVDLDVLMMVAKDYAKHVQHFLNVC